MQASFLPLTQDFHHERRLKLLEQVADNSIIIVAAASEVLRNADTSYPFRQNSDFHYLTGFSEPDAFLILKKGDAKPYTLFVRPKDPLQETWNGRRFGVEGVIEHFNADQSFPIEELEQHLPKLLSNIEHIYYSVFRNDHLDNVLKSALKQVRQLHKNNSYAVPFNIHDLDIILHQQRLIKTNEEIALMQAACDISVAAHMQAMAITKPDLFEYHLASQINHYFSNHNATFAYENIVGSGENACILHYRENNTILKSGDLVLIDAGAELYGYCADITHTYPISGSFSGAQLALYELVREALNKSTLKMTSAHHFNEFHDETLAVLTQGLIDMGLIKASFDSAMEDKLYLPFYMHGTGH